MGKSQNEDRFLKLLDEHKGIVYKICRSYCPNPTDRDDVTQEVLVQLWRSFGSYDDRYKFSTWLYRVALNVAISFYRRESRSRRRVTLGDDKVLEAAEDPAAEGAELHAIYDLIERLNPLNRALMLLHLDGNSYREIADVLGITESNVATKLSRLKQALKQQYAAASST